MGAESLFSWRDYFTPSEAFMILGNLSWAH